MTRGPGRITRTTAGEPQSRGPVEAATVRQDSPRQRRKSAVLCELPNGALDFVNPSLLSGLRMWIARCPGLMIEFDDAHRLAEIPTKHLCAGLRGRLPVEERHGGSWLGGDGRRWARSALAPKSRSMVVVPSQFTLRDSIVDENQTLAEGGGRR